jgi:hypothetical protein
VVLGGLLPRRWQPAHVSHWRQNWKVNGLASRFFVLLADPGAFVMEQKVLRGIKERAEAAFPRWLVGMSPMPKKAGPHEHRSIRHDEAGSRAAPAAALGRPAWARRVLPPHILDLWGM